MSNVRKIEEAAFDQEVLASTQPVLIDFYADWCGPCKMIAPVVDQIAEGYAGKLMVGKVDVDNAQSIAMRFGVMGIPTLGIFQNGQMVDRLVGYPGPAGVREFVEKNLPTA